jgi:hypothetical protein
MSDPVEKFARSRGYQIVPDEIAQRADIVICGSLGPDNVPGAIRCVCADCGAAIVHGPNEPSAPKVCRACGTVRLVVNMALGARIIPVGNRADTTAVMLHRSKPEGSA